MHLHVRVLTRRGEFCRNKASDRVQGARSGQRAPPVPKVLVDVVIVAIVVVRRAESGAQKLRMVLHVAPDASQILHHGDVEGGEVRLGAHAGQHQQLRRADGACRQNHFFPRPDHALDSFSHDQHAGGGDAVEKHARRLRILEDEQIRPLLDWAQKCLCGVIAHAVLGRHLRSTKAGLARAVQVVVSRSASSRRVQ